MDDRERAEVVARLARNRATGHLSTATYEHRKGAALRAATSSDLFGLTWDLPALGVFGLRSPDSDSDSDSPLGADRACSSIEFEAQAVELHVGLGSGEWLIGRAADCDIVIDDHAVSRRHALLSSRAGCCSIRDLGSRNGSLLNNRRIDGIAVLRPMDVLVFGRSSRALVF